jgi:myo-inositol-hexaphosphate 3-phosphohydrolase
VKGENQIVEPPDELDGAKVIAWTWSGIKPFGLIPIMNDESDSDSSNVIEVYGLAICRYEDSDNVYRFSCDKDWVVQQDGLYESVDDAIRELPDQYKLVTAKWKTK